MNGRDDLDVESHGDGLSDPDEEAGRNHNVEEQTLVDGGKATCDGAAVTDIVEAEEEDVGETGFAEDMLAVVHNEMEREEGTSRLSVADENDHEEEVLDLPRDESEIEQEVFEDPDSDPDSCCVYVCERVCRDGCVCDVRRSEDGKTRLETIGVAFPFARLLHYPNYPTWLGCSAVSEDNAVVSTGRMLIEGDPKLSEAAGCWRN